MTGRGKTTRGKEGLNDLLCYKAMLCSTGNSNKIGDIRTGMVIGKE